MLPSCIFYVCLHVCFFAIVGQPLQHLVGLRGIEALPHWQAVYRAGLMFLCLHLPYILNLFGNLVHQTPTAVPSTPAPARRDTGAGGHQQSSRARSPSPAPPGGTAEGPPQRDMSGGTDLNLTFDGQAEGPGLAAAAGPSGFATPVSTTGGTSPRYFPRSNSPAPPKHCQKSAMPSAMALVFVLLCCDLFEPETGLYRLYSDSDMSLDIVPLRFGWIELDASYKLWVGLLLFAAHLPFIIEVLNSLLRLRQSSSVPRNEDLEFFSLVCYQVFFHLVYSMDFGKIEGSWLGSATSSQFHPQPHVSRLARALLVVCHTVWYWDRVIDSLLLMFRFRISERKWESMYLVWHLIWAIYKLGNSVMSVWAVLAALFAVAVARFGSPSVAAGVMRFCGANRAVCAAVGVTIPFVLGFAEQFSRMLNELVLRVSNTGHISTAVAMLLFSLSLAHYISLFQAQLGGAETPTRFFKFLQQMQIKKWDDTRFWRTVVCSKLLTCAVIMWTINIPETAMKDLADQILEKLKAAGLEVPPQSEADDVLIDMQHVPGPDLFIYAALKSAFTFVKQCEGSAWALMFASSCQQWPHLNEIWSLEGLVIYGGLYKSLMWGFERMLSLLNFEKKERDIAGAKAWRGAAGKDEVTVLLSIVGKNLAGDFTLTVRTVASVNIEQVILHEHARTLFRDCVDAAHGVADARLATNPVRCSNCEFES